MVRKYNFKPYTIEIGMYLEEGDISVVEDAEADFGQKTVKTFESPLKKGDYVALDTTQDLTVKIAGTGDEVIGELIDSPRWNGDRPLGGAEAGDYTKRIATVRLYGNYVTELPLSEDNTAIAVGDSVALESANTFDKTSTANNTRALKAVDALAGGSVPVIMGFYGV